MSLSGDKGVAQFKKSVKMGHPILHIDIQIPPNTLKYQGCLEEPKLAILAHCAPPPPIGNALMFLHLFTLP